MGEDNIVLTYFLFLKLVYGYLVLQERLNRQQEENDLERKRLEDLISRLEIQLREQTRMLDEVSDQENRINNDKRFFPCLLILICRSKYQFYSIYRNDK